MEPTDDPKLSELLKEWRIPDAPPSLDVRVLGAPNRWWSFLFTGSIRIPVPVGIAIAALLLVMAGALVRQRTVTSPPAASISLVDFRPVQNLHVRVIRGHEAN